MNNQDRGLLELAAKAAGYKVEIIDHITPHGIWDKQSSQGNIFWNPLASDADALRLSVDLRLCIYHADLAVVIKHKQYSWEWMGEAFNEDDGDRHEATRRVIVRAAAEIGRSMK